MNNEEYIELILLLMSRREFSERVCGLFFIFFYTKAPS